MIKLGKCQMAVCNCSVLAGENFCSQNCRQAAAQGLEREYCQCSHESCKADAGAILGVDPAGLKESFRFFEAGQITIDYRDKDHLVGQLQALAACLALPEESWHGSLPAQTAGDDLERRPAASEIGPGQADAQSA